MNDETALIGIDLGGTKIEMGIVDSTGKVRISSRQATQAKEGPEAVLNQLVGGIKELQAQAPQWAIQGIGIGVPGQVDGHGNVLFAPNLANWQNIPLGSLLSNALNLPVAVLNDVRSIAMGEWKFGAAKGMSNVICMMLGTGIGGAVILNNALIAGHSNVCGEIGHMSIDFHGAECTCGNRGCLETFAGGWGIARQAKEAIAFYGEAGSCMLDEAHGKVEEVTARTVIEAYRKNDRLAQLIIERVKTALIAGCANLANALNPACFILGGGIVNGLPEIIPWVSKGINQIALKASQNDLRVLPGALGKEAGVIGAAFYTKEKYGI